MPRTWLDIQKVFNEEIRQALSLFTAYFSDWDVDWRRKRFKEIGLEEADLNLG